MSVTQPKDKLDVQVSILRLFSCGAATAYSLGREPQVLSRQRRKAAERRPRYDEVNSDCGRRSAASRAFCLVFLGLTPQAICGRCSAAVVRATSTLVRRACTLVMLASICVFAGCGDSLPATVSGKVTIDGKDLSGNENVTGNVVFYPSGGGAAAFGNVSAGGNYEVTTGSTKGIEPGEYKVTAASSRSNRHLQADSTKLLHRKSFFRRNAIATSKRPILSSRSKPAVKRSISISLRSSCSRPLVDGTTGAPSRTSHGFLLRSQFLWVAFFRQRKHPRLPIPLRISRGLCMWGIPVDEWSIVGMLGSMWGSMVIIAK